MHGKLLSTAWSVGGNIEMAAAGVLQHAMSLGESICAGRMQALMMAGSFTGPAVGGVLADALGVRCANSCLSDPWRR